MARILRALSSKTQAQFGDETGIEPSLVALFEVGKAVPRRDQLDRMAAAVGLTSSHTEELLRFVETLRRPRQRRGAGAGDLLERIEHGVRTEVNDAYRRLLSLRLPDAVLQVEGRQRAAELFDRLEGLPEETRLAVIQVTEECWSWALCERVCEASCREASRDVRMAAAWAHLARQIAERVRGSEAWRNRIQGYAAAHLANVLRVSGDLSAAEAVLKEAKRLWQAGADPAGVLDPGRLLDLEASLCRAQRRLPEALALLDQAAVVGRSPERALIQKGATLEVMGRYEAAVEALLRALPIVQRKDDRRLEAMLYCNLALNYCQLGCFTEAGELASRARTAALEMGDEIGALRVAWTQGRIAAGLGRSREARDLLARARREFAARGMDYDAALALLEEAAILLAEGRPREVKALARELAALFDSKGVHREALAALRLFREAVDQEQATAELARSILGYLFRARHDPGLRFAC
jgi:tetratricopeptide (TPR) repeat protein